MNEKERIEREALTYFLRLYNKKFDTDYHLHERRERPDFEVKDRRNGDLLGVEVSHIFHDKKEAMMILGRDPSNFHGIINTDDHAKVINYVLKKKGERAGYYPYDGHVVLVIRDFSRLFDSRTIKKHTTGIKVPKCPYKEIWYLTRGHHDHKWDELIRLK